MMGTFLREEFTRNLLTSARRAVRLAGDRRVPRRVDPRRYNGATLLGLRGIVVKSHGSADRLRVPPRDRARASRRRATASCERIARARSRSSPARGALHRGGVHEATRASSAPAATCRRAVVTNASSRRGVDTRDEWIVRAHRHPRSATSPTSGSLERPRARGEPARRSQAAGTSAGGHRSDHRRHLDARTMVFPSTACLLQAKLGVKRGARRSTCRRCAAASSTRWPTADSFMQVGREPQRAGGRRRGVLAHPRLERPRAPACCSATAPARWCSTRGRSPACIASVLHADGSQAGILVGAGQRVRRRGSSAARSCRWTGRRCSSSRCGCSRRSARETLAAAACSIADIDWLIPHQANVRILDATAQEARLAAEKLRRHRRPARQHLGRLGAARARRGACATGASSAGTACCCRASAAASPGARPWSSLSERR